MTFRHEFRLTSLLAGLVLGLLPIVAQAEALLTVRKHQAAPEAFTMDMLHAFPQVVIETTTPWTEGQQRFVGVALHTLLGDISGSDMIQLRAVNDYVVEMPASAVSAQYPVVAYERNGNAMSVRDKGPLWLVYPFDADISFRTETTFSRSIWQLVEITVEP